MAKNTTKKIKQLKGEKPEKITNEQLNKVQSMISEINQTQFEIGRLESQKHGMLRNVIMINKGLDTMKSEFEKEYGTSDINIQDGTINHPKEDVKTD